MNKYEVIETIGEGAYGIVLKCRNKETGELVAVKRFKESEEDELVKKTTMREVKILRMLKDEPFVVHLLEAFRRKGKLYLVFEYVGCNLLEWLESRPQGLELEEVRRMVFTLLVALHSCHSKGVIHRDIKPENLLVTPADKTLRLCDFGFARAYAAANKDLTDYVATRWYRSPELLLGTTDYGLPSDLWAVGCIMAELLDGNALFPGETELDQIFLIQNLLGNYSAEQKTVFHANKRFAGRQLTDIARPETTLDRKFGHRGNKRALHLLHSLLVIDPSMRLTVEQALVHPFFEGLQAQLCPSLQIQVSSSSVPSSFPAAAASTHQHSRPSSGVPAPSSSRAPTASAEAGHHTPSPSNSPVDGGVQGATTTSTGRVVLAVAAAGPKGGALPFPSAGGSALLPSFAPPITGVVPASAAVPSGVSLPARLGSGHRRVVGGGGVPPVAPPPSALAAGGGGIVGGCGSLGAGIPMAPPMLAGASTAGSAGVFGLRSHGSRGIGAGGDPATGVDYGAIDPLVGPSPSNAGPSLGGVPNSSAYGGGGSYYGGHQSMALGGFPSASSVASAPTASAATAISSSGGTAAYAYAMAPPLHPGGSGSAGGAAASCGAASVISTQPRTHSNERGGRGSGSASLGLNTGSLPRLPPQYHTSASYSGVTSTAALQPMQLQMNVNLNIGGVPAGRFAMNASPYSSSAYAPLGNAGGGPGAAPAGINSSGNGGSQASRSSSQEHFMKPPSRQAGSISKGYHH